MLLNNPDRSCLVLRNIPNQTSVLTQASNAISQISDVFGVIYIDMDQKVLQKCISNALKYCLQSLVCVMTTWSVLKNYIIEEA